MLLPPILLLLPDQSNQVYSALTYQLIRQVCVSKGVLLVDFALSALSALSALFALSALSAPSTLSASFTLFAPFAPFAQFTLFTLFAPCHRHSAEHFVVYLAGGRRDFRGAIGGMVATRRKTRLSACGNINKVHPFFLFSEWPRKQVE